jgi:hypothetical protein
LQTFHKKKYYFKWLAFSQDVFNDKRDLTSYKNFLRLFYERKEKKEERKKEKRKKVRKKDRKKERTARTFFSSFSNWIFSNPISCVNCLSDCSQLVS